MAPRTKKSSMLTGKQIQLLFVLVVGNLVVLGALAWVMVGIVSSQKDVEAIERELSVELATHRSFESMKKVLVETTRDRERLESYFIGPDDIAPILETIEGYGRQAGVVVGFDDVRVQEVGFDEVLQLTIAAEGRFSDLFYFYSILEVLPLKVSFDRVFMEKDMREDDRFVEDKWGGSFVATVESYRKN